MAVRHQKLNANAAKKANYANLKNSSRIFAPFAFYALNFQCDLGRFS